MRPVVALVGLDTRDGQLWTWQWHDQDSWSTPHHVDQATTRQVRDLLAAALPGKSSASTRRSAAHPLGPLAFPDTEWQVSAQVARLLFPPALGEEIVRRGDTAGDRVLFRVFPSPSTAAVPWELLPVGTPADPHRRLLDVADVVHLSPLLPRDSDPDHAPPAWADVSAQPPLHIIDPDQSGLPRVLTDDAVAAWRAAYPGLVGRRGQAVRSAFGDRVDRWWLARQLPGRSRLLYVGHVAAPHGDAQSTGLLLSCRRCDYSADERPIGTLHRYFTARDAVRGTLDYTELTGDPARARGLFGVASPLVGPRPGPVLDASGRPSLRPGREIWPMPPRVAIIGCRSGSDTSFEEPFGLVTAFLHAGAHLVTATRWTLYTGETFREWGCPGDPLDAAARAIDTIQQSDDPAAGLSAWQRARLAAWRADGRMLDTPLVWAALTTYDGGPRVLSTSSARPRGPRD